MPWFAIRTVYHFGVKDNGTDVFEERVVCFEAASWDEAHDKAHEESERYAREGEVEAHPAQEGYELDDGALIDGHEV
ncbi:MAG TPA: DUF4288 domain-containing protein, partial [Rubricoccaceae bacterium]